MFLFSSPGFFITGKRNTNVDPSPGVLSTQILPLCLFIISALR